MSIPWELRFLFGEKRVAIVAKCHFQFCFLDNSKTLSAPKLIKQKPSFHGQVNILNITFVNVFMIIRGDFDVILTRKIRLKSSSFEKHRRNIELLLSKASLKYFWNLTSC